MPRGDKTGPNGNGSKTGRALGYCTGNSQAGFENNTATFGRGNGFGRRNGFGNGLGRGMQYRHGVSQHVYNTENVKEETLIQNQINILKDQLEYLEKKLNTLKN